MTFNRRPSRSSNLMKWDVLFDKKISEWMHFKPKLGLQVYPCYTCRDMFGSKNSFLDHVNRRGILLKYRCTCASDPLIFYNPCALLLHTREHYSLLGGQINLECLEVSMLPFGLGGFLPDPNIPMLYDVEDDSVGETAFVNTRFYSPVPQTMGQALVALTPNELLFLYNQDANMGTVSLVLKQVSLNIPRCRFVALEDNTRLAPIPNGVDMNGRVLTMPEANNNNVSDVGMIKEEPAEDVEYDMPIITKIETIDESPDGSRRNSTEQEESFPSCPECKEVQTIPMGEHFLKTDNPFQESLRCPICKYIAPTKCSLQAHGRIHNSQAPFVCPECGKNFESWLQLQSHMEDLCFHLTKQVRLRCPGKKCGKIFAQVVKFSAHFLAHMQSFHQCKVCDDEFKTEAEFRDHIVMHDRKFAPVMLHRCAVCADKGETFTFTNFQEHIREHAACKKQCLYVYVCKRCHSYFRSTQTYATHFLRCSKPFPLTNSQIHTRSIMTEEETRPTNKRKSNVFQATCTICKVHVRSEHMNEKCGKCGGSLSYKKRNMGVLFKVDSEDENEASCLLCDMKFPIDDTKDHSGRNRCKYQNARVVLNCNMVKEYLYSRGSPKSDDSGKKKRRKSKHRKASLSESNQNMEVEEPVPFDGTYHCKLCDYHNTDRREFQEHILQHRDVCTAYQCMECGECFVVKPSLVKHLLFYHDVADADKYFENNSCFNKEAVKELESIMRLAPGESKDPVAENQCRVCLERFPDKQELNKHFRVHGMAFLLKNTK